MTLRISCEPVAIADADADCRAVVSVSMENFLQLDRLELALTNDYYSSFRRSKTTSHMVTAEEYLFGMAEKWMDNSLLCPEMPLPRHLVPAVRLMIPVGTLWSNQAVALVHAGRSGCMAPLHFDWDHSFVAHICLVGRKRFFLFPPQAGWLLSPIINTSALCVPRFSEPDRHELINRLSGMEVILEAGQGILFPSMFWHGALYEEPSLSVSIRFEPRPGGRPFAALPRSWLLQRLVWQFFQQGYGMEASEFLTDYLNSFFQEKGSWKDRYRRVTALCRQALLDCGEQQGATELVAENFSAEMVLASQELKLWYSNVHRTNQSTDDDLVRKVMEYLVEANNCLPAASIARLAAYALKVRQGLPPQRGIIEILQE
jgi:hypothetical protein